MADDTHDILRQLVAKARCKPGWTFRLQDEDGALRFVVHVPGYDSARPDDLTPMAINHFFPVPTATYNEKTWRRWMFERCRGIENHELGEWFRIGSEMPFAPLHGPGEDPYTVHEFRPDVDALTTQNGSIRQPYE
jgi:hypothetical protein